MYAVVMAGGSGTRFWPASRRKRPKQFLNITGKGPMVVETCNRLSPLVPDNEMIIILGKDHEEEAEHLFKGREIHILAEPVGRNTAPCIGLGAVYAEHLGCKGAIAFLPADHYIRDEKSFLSALNMAARLAEKGGIVTLGIVPTRPETGYGYIKRDDARKGQNGNYYAVSSFVEKPDFDTARKYLTHGGYYWNAGIFVSTPETILREMEIHLPHVYAGLMEIKESIGTDSFLHTFEKAYNRMESVSFDYGIMEKTEADVYVVPCECGWSDVGSWGALYEMRSSEYDENGNLVEGDALLIDCRKCFVSARGGRLVATLGLENCVVVDMPDSILVADLNRSQEIRKVVDNLKKNGKESLL